MRCRFVIGTCALLGACAQYREAADGLVDAAGRDSDVWTVEGELLTEYLGADGAVENGDMTLAAAAVLLEVDLDRAGRVQGGTARLDARSTRGGEGGTSAFQGASGLAAPDGDQIAELWYQQLFADDQLRIRAGLLDANREFAAIESAGGFFNSSAGTSPTILGIPTWPATAPGVEMFAEGNAGPRLGIGLYHGAHAAPLAEFEQDRDLLPSGAFAIGELGLRWAGHESSPSGRLGFGVWYSDAGYGSFSGDERTGTGGLYALGEQCLWRGDEAQSLYLFGLYGRADESLAEAGQHMLAGLSLVGFLPGRPENEVGLLVSRVDLSDDPAAGFAADETAVELQCGVRISDGTSIRLSLQRVDNPSGESGADELLMGMRFSVTF